MEEYKKEKIEESDQTETSSVKQKRTLKQNKQDTNKKEEPFEGLSIEEAFEKLNRIIGSLDGEEIPLEESFRLYQEGVQLLQYCNAKVDMVEKQMIVLNGAESQNGF